METGGGWAHPIHIHLEDFWVLHINGEPTPPEWVGRKDTISLLPGWKAEGRPGDIDAIRRKLGFFDRDPQVDSDLSQHTGMIRIGNEAYDRWSMMPAMLTPRQLANAIVRL